MTTPSTTTAEKISLALDALAITLSATALILNQYAEMPDWIGTAAIILLGSALSFAAWRWLSPTSHSALLHRLFVALMVVTTAAGAIWALPDHESAATSKERTPTSNPGAPSTPRSDLAEGIEVTKLGSVTPERKLTQVPHCLTVSGSGKLPQGYWPWVANTPDADGHPEAGSYNNMQRATQDEGKTRWTTARFGVGKEGQRGETMWIHVFLLPESADRILKPVHGGAWGISGSYAGTAPVESFKVQHDGEGTC